jgi:hypothetical protein
LELTGGTRSLVYWWNDVLIVSNSKEFLSGVINVLLHGVINVLVYEAPKELVVNNV